MGNEEAVAIARAALEEKHRTFVSAHREGRQSAPWWTPLTNGLMGPALVLWPEVSGLARLLLPVPFVVAVGIALVVQKRRLRDRVRPRAVRRDAALRNEIRANMKEYKHLRPRLWPSVVVSTVLITGFMLLREANVTLWFLVPASFCLFAGHGIWWHGYQERFVEAILAAQAPE